MIDRQTETGARLLDGLLGAAHAIDRHVQRGPIFVKLLLADGRRRDQLFAPRVVLFSEH